MKTAQAHFEAAHYYAKQIAKTPIFKHELISKLCAELKAALAKGK